ncbi:hypothetical protein NYR55_04300 [Sphingomonas sp. BGYR3]|uniref:hypothetical protein n=1 Tax=Sphingomonas sp. BGYR3 TaxID=2975483 RepID=UPI0021A6D8FC|nr:hypothetical protein [Sphingomonas sp. BGYR3]MDG5487840.1 hypothetical protein [Sphingomonas sp. BGYR3]
MLMAAKIGWFASPSDSKMGGAMRFLVENDGDGGERFNFTPDPNDGQFYGYIKGKQGKAGAIHDQPPFPGDGPEDGWTIAFVSRDAQRGGQRLIGWYEDARFVYDMRDGFRVHRRHPSNDGGIYCVVAARAFFVPPVERVLDLTQGDRSLNSTFYSWLGSLDGNEAGFQLIRQRIESEIARLSQILNPIDEAAIEHQPPPQVDTDGAVEPPTVPGGGGEGAAHAALRLWVLDNPQQVIPDCGRVLWAETEFVLPSADVVDVAVGTDTIDHVIEVKSRISNDADFRRGVFQCVKYRAVYEALYGRTPGAVLVTQRTLPDNLAQLCDTLDIRYRVIQQDPA